MTADVGFVERIRTGDHLILFYDTQENKRRVLFKFLAAGLRRKKRGVYIASEESPEQIRSAMMDFGVDAPRYEAEGSLIIHGYLGWYIEGGGCCAPDKISAHWLETAEDARRKGLKGLSATGETDCFIRHNKLRELLRYEYVLHKRLKFPAEAICAYSITGLVNAGWQDLIMPLIRAHGQVIFTGPGGVMLRHSEKVEDADIESLLHIKM
ncbi:MAG: MEDS domain-containing protein [Thaumarchaeota archaeon]|nr:MEDS domain-containing protein [Nitrososphaerota archaeon]